MSDRQDTKVNFVPLEDTGGLDRLFQTSFERPVLLFKHSLTCGVSADAYAELAKYAGPVELVIVQTARGVADEIETRTGIRHESPQAILLVRGEPVWRASHWNVKAEAVTAAVNENR